MPPFVLREHRCGKRSFIETDMTERAGRKKSRAHRARTDHGQNGRKGGLRSFWKGSRRGSPLTCFHLRASRALSMSLRQAFALEAARRRALLEGLINPLALVGNLDTD